MQIVLFKHGFEYCNYMCADLDTIDNIITIEPYSFGGGYFWKKACGLHRKVTKRTDNFSRIWYRAFLDFHKFQKNEKIAFCFFDSSYELYNKKFLQWLKQQYPNSKNYVFILNPLCDDKDKVAYYKEVCDGIYSHDSYDCQKYGLRFFYGFMPTKQDVFTYPMNRDEYDLCFVGRDKGRYPQIKALYKRLSDTGIRCLFYVLTDRVPKDQYDQAICKTKRISFMETLDMEASSSILLDYTFVAGGMQGFTLRVMDAVGMEKKIISNNKTLTAAPIWNENNMAVVDSLDDITPSFVKGLLEKKKLKFAHKEIFSPLRVIDDIKQDFE